MSWTLAVTALGTGFGALVYLSLARMLWERPLSGDSRFGARAFAGYWAFTGAFQAMIAAQHGLAAAGVAHFWIAVLVRYVGIALATAGVALLLCYLAYLRTGSRRATRPILAVYALVGALTVAHIALSRPDRVVLTDWSVDVGYANDFMAGMFAPLMLMLLGVPILAALWYLTIFPRLSGARKRYRVIAVGLGISLQLSAFLVARIVENELWQLISRTLLGVVVAALVWSAYASGFPEARDLEHAKAAT